MQIHSFIRSHRWSRSLFILTFGVILSSVLAYPAGADEPPADEPAACVLPNGYPCPDASKAEIIAKAKMEAALLYSAQVDGATGNRFRLERLDRQARALAGEPAGPVVASSPESVLSRGVSPSSVPKPGSRVQTQFWPFEQANYYYCGPATAQSILYFLGARRSAQPNDSGDHDVLIGEPVHDQSVLASDSWLAADKYEGTLWGLPYMPFTLNAWRGTDWYVGSATPNLEGGTLTKEQALAAIRYDTDRGFPVAENVEYSARTYYPMGFHPGITYQHWDVVFGHFKAEDGTQMVQIGQTYHEPGLPYDRFPSVAWDVHWTAIETWFGIVW